MSRWRVLAVVLVALNLRPAIVALGPVLETIRADTGLSATLAGLLATLGVLCLGLFSPLGPVLARRVGLEVAVALGLVVIAGALLLRLATPVLLLFVGTALAGAGIAVCNVLIPALIKRDAPSPGPITGVYSSALNVGAGLSAGLTVPLMLALGLGWRTALASWALLAGVGLLAWAPLVRSARARREERERGVSAADLAADRDLGQLALLRDPLARRVVLFLGLQSVEFYSFAAWFPTLLQSDGVDPGRAGTLLAVSNVLGAVGAVVVPSLAGRFATQRPLVAIVGVAYVVSLVGLVVAPAAGALAWAAVFGAAQGAGFALGLTLVVLRSPDPAVAAVLSSVAQLGGYVIASAGPVVLGAVHDATGGWTVPVLILLALVAPMLWAGHGAGRVAHVQHPHRAPVTAP
ncbi:MFS transporter [Rhodococcus aerolatus]